MSEIVTEAPDVADIIGVAREAERRKLTLHEIDPTKDYVTLDSDGRVEIPNLETLREHPDHTEGTYRPATLASLIAYVEEHRQEGATTVWVHESEGCVVVILDDHAAAKPGWRRHRAVLNLRPSTEWLYWTRLDGELLDQEAFAEHLQEGIPDILKPDAATLIEVAEKFQATTSVKFRSGVDRTSGEVKFLYDESTEATSSTAAGDISVPRGFTLALAPFIGEERVEVEARLRYRAKNGSLSIGYKLERPERIVEEALDRIANELGTTFDRVYRGSPA